MRTTLDLEDDILAAARERARQRGVSIGEVLSDLARQAQTRQVATTTRGDLPLFPTQPSAGVATVETVNHLLGELS